MTTKTIRDRIVELRRVRAAELRPNPRNWRRHPKRQREALRALLSEVDLAVWNDDSPWSSFGPVFVVECKNWDRKVGSAEVAWFDWKMRLGGVTTGILLSAEGVTGEVRYLENARAIVARANQDRSRDAQDTSREMFAAF
jgi:hypothetical protein